MHSNIVATTKMSITAFFTCSSSAPASSSAFRSSLRRCLTALSPCNSQLCSKSVEEKRTMLLPVLSLLLLLLFLSTQEQRMLLACGCCATKTKICEVLQLLCWHSNRRFDSGNSGNTSRPHFAVVCQIKEQKWLFLPLFFAFRPSESFCVPHRTSHAPARSVRQLPTCCHMKGWCKPHLHTWKCLPVTVSGQRAWG